MAVTTLDSIPVPSRCGCGYSVGPESQVTEASPQIHPHWHALDNSEAELYDLLAHLAHFLRTNESSISGEQVAQCMQCLSGSENSALNRLFCLSLQRQNGQPEKENHTRRRRTMPRPPRVDILRPHSSNCQSKEARNHETSPSTIPEVVSSRSTLCIEHEQCDNANSTVSIANQGSSPPSDLTMTLVAEEASTTQQIQSSTLEVHDGLEDTISPIHSLAGGGKIHFTPSTRCLLEACRTDRARFLKAIKDAKVSLPAGQGWEAAIAIKKENADIRDLTRIYHRFECYNIYRHVVEAGYHTGMHWIRGMRPQLVERLCQDFPDRFPRPKTANKCLAWVDQGCRYREWSEMFSDTADLGYLIALPSGIPHSAYTSRCTKEKMMMAALDFIGLGISEVVDRLELSDLADHIAKELREMTGKKRENNVGESPHDSPMLRGRNGSSTASEASIQGRGGPRRSLPSPRSAGRNSQSANSPCDERTSTIDGEMLVPSAFDRDTLAEDCSLFSRPAHSFTPTVTQEQNNDYGWQKQHIDSSSLDDFAVMYDPFMDFELTVPSTDRELFMQESSSCVLSTNEWY